MLRVQLWFVLVAASAFAQQASNAPPDTIFFNGKIITVDAGFTVRALAGKNPPAVGLKGAAVIPGLSDSHDHLYNSEKVMRGIDLAGATTTDEVLRRLRDGMAKAKPGETVYGSVGWRAPLRRKFTRRGMRTVLSNIVLAEARQQAEVLAGAPILVAANRGVS